MPANRVATVTQNGMTARQPGVSVSATRLGSEEVMLHVHRHYANLPNKWGGLGRNFPCEADGTMHVSIEAAYDYALAKGYLMVYRGGHSAYDQEARRARIERKLFKLACNAQERPDDHAERG